MRDTRVDATWTPARATARWVGRHPRSLGAGTVTEITALYVGYQTMLVAAGVAVVAGASWRVLDRPTFDRFAGRLLRAWWRRWVVYQRKWARIAAACGLLTSDHKGRTLVPKILRARSTWCWDTLHLRLALGQTAADYQDVADRLADAYRARRATVRTLKPGRIAVDFQRFEPFDDLHIAPPELAESADEVDLCKLVIGRDEYGRTWPVDLLEGLHLLLAGATGAGKASVLWGLLRALAPLIRDGLVRLWVIDPKGGMEFGQGRAMFHDYADNDEDGLALMERYTKVLDQRKAAFGRAGIREFTPSVETPLELLVVDELAAMTEYADRMIGNEFEKLLGKALTQYRAPGGRVVGAVQEPTKDNVPMRGLFPNRIALRVDSPSYVDMTLGEGMHDKGAFADQIPEYLPGVGYCKTSGRREPLRVRAGYCSDADIAELVRFATSLDAEVLDFPTTPSSTASDDDIEDAEVVDDYEYIDPDDNDDDEDAA